MEQPRYEVMEKSFIGGALLEAGEEVTFSGVPGSKLRPLNDEAKAAVEAARSGALLEAGDKLAVPGSDDDGNEELSKLREDYELLFNEKPHHNAKAETLREKIADKRKELGV